jgi:FMN phosphatase YigB (HAD superfamily)
VLFDFGGTLAVCPAWMDLELGSLVDAVLEGLAARGWPVPVGIDRQRGRSMLAHLREVARATWMECSAQRCLEAILPLLGVAVPPAWLLGQVLEDIYGRLLPEVRWVPGSRHLLVSLAEAGVALGLVSNAAYSPFLRRVLAEAKVEHMFGAVVISAEAGWRKPHPAAFLRALADLGVAAEHSCHVGDHFHQDVVGAARLGIRPVWVRGASGEAKGWSGTGVPAALPPPMSGLPAPVVVPDLSAAAAYLLAAVREGRSAGGRSRPGR